MFQAYNWFLHNVLYCNDISICYIQIHFISFKISYDLSHCFVTVSQLSCGKVMFSRVSVSLSTLPTYPYHPTYLLPPYLPPTTLPTPLPCTAMSSFFTMYLVSGNWRLRGEYYCGKGFYFSSTIVYYFHNCLTNYTQRI